MILGNYARFHIHHQACRRPRDEFTKAISTVQNGLGAHCASRWPPGLQGRWSCQEKASSGFVELTRLGSLMKGHPRGVESCGLTAGCTEVLFSTKI